MSLNKVILIGHVGKDPEVRHTQTGQTVASFSVATKESWADKSGAKQERTEWHKIIVWGKLAEVCAQYAQKGTQVFIEGKIQTREWQDQDGIKKHSTEVSAQNVQFLGGKEKSANPVKIKTPDKYGNQ